MQASQEPLVAGRLLEALGRSTAQALLSSPSLGEGGRQGSPPLRDSLLCLRDRVQVCLTASLSKTPLLGLCSNPTSGVTIKEHLEF